MAVDAAAAARYADVIGTSPHRLRVVRGQDADVALDGASGLAYRFPRHPRAAADLPRNLALLQAIEALRLPVATPAVVRHDVGAPPGRAYVATRLIPGEALDHDTVDALGPHRAQTLAEDLAALLSALHSAPPPAALLAAPRDAAWWRDFAARASDALLHVLPPASRRRAEDELRAAVDAAEQAPDVVLTHGDLGGRNVLLDPATGRLTGVLDWDAAALGDPALDLASLSTGLTHDVLERLFRIAPDLRRTQVARAHAYAGTFALQQALAGFETGDLDAVADGLETYR